MADIFEPGFRADGRYVPNPYFMDRAIELGHSCIENGDHPVGAVVTIVKEFQIAGSHETVEREVMIGEGRNEVHRLGTPAAHAEMLAISKACIEVGRQSLSRSVLYTTHESCPMCAGAAANAKLAGVVYSTSVEDVEYLKTQEMGLKWRSNAVRMETILAGRVESDAVKPFIMGGFMREEGYRLLSKTVELVIQKPADKRERYYRWLIESGVPEDTAVLVTDIQGRNNWPIPPATPPEIYRTIG